MQSDHENAEASFQQYEQLEDFCRNNPIGAVLTPPQLEKLSRVFGLEPSELEANFVGWSKHVLMSKDTVFLFPRNPGFVRTVQRELAVYEWFANVDTGALPRLIQRVKDKEISYYEFGAVTRLKGVPLSGCVRDLPLNVVESILVNLAGVIASWHSMATNHFAEFLRMPARPAPKRITIDNWHKQVLRPETTEVAVDFIYRFVRRLSDGKVIGQKTDTKKKWTAALMELAKLPHVLVHGDLHEDHILIEPPNLTITGIPDWQTARIDNPVWDFNFGEWGTAVCRWHDRLPDLRRSMWHRYLQARNIRVSNLEGLNLFYALWNMVWLIYKRRNGEGLMPTGLGFEDTVRIYCCLLNDLTMAL